MFGHTAEFSENLGVPGMTDAAVMEGQFVKGQRCDGVDAAFERQPGRRREKHVRGPPGAGVDDAGSDLRQITEVRRDGQARNHPRRRVGLFWLRDGLDSNWGLSAAEGNRSFEHGRVADHERPGQVVQPRNEPAPGNHLRTDARHVAHRQCDQWAFRQIHALLLVLMPEHYFNNIRTHPGKQFDYIWRGGPRPANHVKPVTRQPEGTIP